MQVDVDTEQLCQVVETDGANDARDFSSTVAAVVDVQCQNCHRRCERHDRDRYAVVQTYK